MPEKFNMGGYSGFLETALRSGYKFIAFNEKDEFSDSKFCLLRHDIDADLNAALQMAKAEQALGIKSTYFLMLRSPVYNIFGRANNDFVEQIISLGHEIGLHYDEGYYPKDSNDLNVLVNREAEIMNLAFGKKIKVVSFHQPGEQVLNNSIQLTNFLNTYDKKEFEDIFYLSDSNMVWKGETPWELFSKATHPKVQLLIHPMWWVGKGNENTQELWNKALIDNSKRSLDQIVKTERAFGPERFLKF